MTHIGRLCLGGWIIVNVNYTIKSLYNRANHGTQSVIVKRLCILIHKGGESKRGQVTDGSFLGTTVLDDLSTEIAGLDSAKIFLIALLIGCVLV